MEALRLRVKDVDFSQDQIVVRDGKGSTDRITMLPATIKQTLAEHLRRVRLLHQKDLKESFGSVYLPSALERKYSNANKEWCWQYVFPSLTPMGVLIYHSMIPRASVPAASVLNASFTSSRR